MDGDIYEWDNINFKMVKHNTDPFKRNRNNKTKVLGAYCTIIFEDNSTTGAVLSKDEIEALQQLSPSGKKW
ncbi:hypothetical protein SKUN_00862 [Spiroplasma kunkelii CR2-3x]|uniref:Uncharacterized protein n=1 Tax=Spiroplasma kunkelii CR2-3x TaxID=273035 RepID=A0A0K2JH65_SPIKU|nr:hypothetical protein [Spiroplasma kunkelii]ALA97752.1 hypothetical protein SKUN_00862 [Spiroplasma kunkelii CR2-3x]